MRRNGSRQLGPGGSTLVWILVLVLAVGVATVVVGSGVYWWQKSVADNRVDKLEQKVKSLEGQTGAAQSEDEGRTKTTKYIEEVSKDVILAIKSKDMKKWSSYAHPKKGVRFSPYAYIDAQNDVILTVAQLRRVLKDTRKFSWGTYAGSGAPINLTFKKYYNEFIYDQDFANAKQISFNSPIGQGNTTNNSIQAYPGSTIVEYHFPGTNPQYQGMDWVSLRLVFEKKSGVWYLVGVIHDQWTP